MGEAAQIPEQLGAGTEGLLERTFAHSALITAAQASKVLGLDEKTFSALVVSGAVRAVLIGEKTRRFAEADLRAFLAGKTERVAKQPRPKTNVTARRTEKVVGFLEQKAKRDAAKRQATRAR